MDYNTTRDKLITKEYGRNIQQLIRRAIEIEDKEKRSEFTKMIVAVMGTMNPGIRDSGDFRHKLWDHLHIMADFKLDVDSPYPMPSMESLNKKPDALQYKDSTIRYRMYGVNIVGMIEKAIEYEEGEEKDALTKTIANHMKKSYLAWNRDSVSDDLIAEQLKILSGGKLLLKDEMKLNSTSEILSRNRKKKPPVNQKQSRHKKGNWPKKGRR
jgi:Mg-chelatase subunit ChlI